MPGRTTTVATGSQSSLVGAGAWTLDYDPHALTVGLTVTGNVGAGAMAVITVGQAVFGPVALATVSGAGRQVVATNVSSLPTFGESGGAVVSVRWVI